MSGNIISENTLQSVISIVKEASSLMVGKGYEVFEKDGLANLVTSSDLAVQEFLTGRLSEVLPGSGFICEEEDFHDTSKELFWIIDPIDGTANYSRGIADCCISVALAKKDEGPVLGVVYSPARGELYSAIKGGGAFLNGKPVHVSDRPFENGIFCCAMSTYRKEFAKTCSDIIYDVHMRSNDTRRWGSAAIELCLLASGFVELYFEMRLQPWDYAAGELILTEAGGCIASFDGKAPSLYAPSLVAAANTPGNLQRLLGIVHDHMDSLPY